MAAAAASSLSQSPAAVKPSPTSLAGCKEKEVHFKTQLLPTWSPSSPQATKGSESANITNRCNWIRWQEINICLAYLVCSECIEGNPCSLLYVSEETDVRTVLSCTLIIFLLLFLSLSCGLSGQLQKPLQFGTDSLAYYAQQTLPVFEPGIFILFF